MTIERRLEKIEQQQAEILAHLQRQAMPAKQVLDVRAEAARRLEDFKRKHGRGK